MAKKKKLLPKDFEQLLEQGNLADLQAVFATCDVNARGGSSKHTAPAFNECPDELVRWLVDQGNDLSAEDIYGETPLHARAGHWQGRLDVLLELGADVNAGEGARGTPLHRAAHSARSANARLLLPTARMSMRSTGRAIRRWKWRCADVATLGSKRWRNLPTSCWRRAPARRPACRAS